MKIGFFKKFTVFVLVFAVLFSNFPADFLIQTISFYQKSQNIVDKFWHAGQERNIVDNLIPLYKLANSLKVPYARALSTANGDGLINYGVSANTTPRWRTYSASTNTFGAETATIAGGTGTNFQMRASPTKQEAIAAYTNASGVLQVMCYDGTSWTNEWSVTAGGAGTKKPFDIAYETNSGDVLVAYSRNAAAVNAVDYRTKLGSTGCGTANWAAAASMPTTTTLTSGTVQWVKAAWDRRAAQNLIAVAWADSASDLGASIWSGTAFGNFPTLAKVEQALEVVAAAQDVDSFDVEYESTSGDVMLVWGSGGTNGTNGAFYNVCTGGTSTCTWGTRTAMPTFLDDATNLDISANPNTDQMVFASIGNSGSDMQVGYWSGSAWTNTANMDITAGTPLAGTKTVATGWLISGATTRSVVVYLDASGIAINWYTGNAGAFTGQTDFTVAPNFNTLNKWQSIEMDPFNKDRLILTVTDANNDVFAKRLIMTSVPAFTWTNSDSSAALQANLPAAIVSPSAFQYWRFIPGTTTLATGSDPAATTIAPGAGAQDVDLFTLQTNSGTETVTSVTVNLSTNNGVGTLAITDNANAVLGSIGGGTGSGIVTGSNAISVSGMSAVSGSATTFKVRATPLSHANMLAPDGADYSITAPVTSWVGSGGYTHTGSDTNTNALTIDNNSPAGTTGAGATSGESTQSTVSWTNPGDGDFQQVYIYCKTSSMISGEAPAEGADPAVDATACDATARMKYKGAASPQTITSLTNGTLYYFRIYARDTNGNFTAYSATQEVSATPSAPAATLTISASAGSKVATKNSGDVDQYAHDTACTSAATCAAFTLAASGGTVNVTSIKVTGNGTVTEDNELSDVNLYYDFDGNWSDAGAETLFGTQAIFAPDQTVTISGTLPPISSGQTAYIYVRYDLVAAMYPTGGATVNFQIANAADVVSDGTESGSGVLAGTQTVKPQITSYTNSTESGLNYAGACTGCGARVGPVASSKSQTVVISGYGFGSDPGSGSRDTASNKVEIGTKLMTDNPGSSNVTAWSNTSITITTDTAIDSDTSYGTNYGGASSLKITAGGQAVPTNLNFYLFPQVTSITTPLISNAARESDSITLNGTRFGSSQGSGVANVLGSSVGVASSWNDTAITANVPTAISDSLYTGSVDMTQGTGANSKTHTYPTTFRVLPKIVSTAPVDVKGGQGQAITIAGDHFCQDTNCADYATDSDDITFNGVSGKASISAMSDTSISVSVPGTATDGNLIVKSDSANGGTVYDSNNYSYNVKFGSTTPTGSSAGGSNNPTINGNAFSDGTDGDTHQKTQWQIAHNTDGDWTTPEWIRTSGSAEITIAVNNTNGTFQNSDNGQTELDCGTTYKGRVRYMDNGNGGADTQTWEWSSYSADYTFATGSCNNLTVGATGTQTANITRGTNTNYLGGSFTLTTNNSAATITSVKISETGNITANNNLNNVKLYYDTDGTWSGTFTETQLGTTQTTFSASEDVTFSGLSLGVNNTTTTYVYVVVDIDADPTSGQLIDIQITNPSTDVAITGASNSDTLVKAITGSTTVANPNVNVASAGTQTALMNSNSTAQYVGGSFTLTMASATGTLTSFAITDNGTVNANTNLNNVKLYSDTDGTYSGGETQLGTTQTFNVSEKATFSTLSLGLTTSATYVYVVFDVNSNAAGGETAEPRVAVSGDVSGTGFSTAGTFPLDITGTTTIRPQITSYTNSTESGLNYAGACTGCGARIGPLSSSKEQTVVISGYGFGAAPALSRATCTGSVNTGCVKILGSPGITIADGNVTAWSNTSITIVTNTETTGNTDSSWGTNFGGPATLRVQAAGQISSTDLNFYLFPQVTSITTPLISNAARESDSITLNGTRFGSSQGSGVANVLGSSVGAASSWNNTAITANVPTAISDSLYTGSVDMTQGTGANSKTHTYPTTFRVLPKTTSVVPNTGADGTSTTISGDHFCQSGACLSAASWNATANDGDDAEWTSNATCPPPALDGPDATVTGTPLHTSIVANSPALSNGNACVSVTSSGYESNTQVFTVANNILTVGVSGSVTASIVRGTTANYMGGAFTFATDTSVATVTSIKVSDIGNITAYNNLNNVKLYGDTGGSITGTYEPGSDTQIGSTQGSFVSGDTVTFGSLSLGVNTTAIYVYVVLDIDADPTLGQVIDLEITNPSIDVAVTGASNADIVAKNITGTTSVANPNMTVASSGTQVVNLGRGSTAQYVGGSFTLTMASATGTLTSFAVTDNGTVNANTNLNNVKLYSDTDGTYSGGETQLGTTQVFNASEKATFGTLSLGLTTATTYIYVVLDVNSAATAGETIEARVTASGDVVGTGFNVSGTFPLDVSGTTTIQNPSLTVSTNGSQTVNLNSGDTAQNIGGSFTFVLTGATGTLNSFIISEIGTVGATANLTNVKLQTDTDGTYPGTDVTGCTVLSFNASQQVSCTPTGGLSLSTTTRYVYVIIDLGSGATGGETIEAQITNPSTDVSVTGASNTDTGAKAITGTTTIRPQITSYTNSTESGLNYAGACTGCGARVGPVASSKSQTVVISGYGFGSDPGSGSRDTASNKVEIGIKLMTDNPGSSNVTAWSNTSITITTDTAIDSDTSYGTNYGGASSLKITAGGQAVPTNLNFYLFPQVTSITTPLISNAARESDSITLNGTRFGSSQGSGVANVLGSSVGAASSWNDTAITANVPTAISDSLYTGSVDMTQGTGANSKTHTYPTTFRVLPKIVLLNPDNGVINDPIIIIGNHFCQTGTCPLAGSRSTASNNITFFNGVQVTDGNVTAWGHGDSSTSGVNVNVPATATTGNVVATSDSYTSNGINFTKLASVPADPTNLYQFETNTDLNEPPASYDPLTETNPAGKVAVGGGINQTNAWLRATASAGVNATLCIEVEAKTVATAFDGIGAVLATSAPGCQAFTVGTPVKLFVNVTSGLTDGNNYKWRARIKNNGTSEYGNWVNASVDGQAKSFYIDTSAPSSLSLTCPPSAYTASTADLSWSPADNMSTTFTKQAQYDDNSDFSSSICTPDATCGTPTGGLGANAQTTQLTGLAPSTVYYYRSRSKDAAGNEKIEGYGISSNTTCTFTTSQAQMRTAEYIITGETGAVSAAVSRAFQVYVTEQGSNIQNAFVEISGIAGTGGGASLTFGMKVVGSADPGYTNYDVAVSNTVATPFTILHRVNPTASGLYIAPTQATSNNLWINPSVGPSVYIASAKIVVTYYYTPQ